MTSFHLSRKSETDNLISLDNRSVAFHEDRERIIKSQPIKHFQLTGIYSRKSLFACHPSILPCPALNTTSPWSSFKQLYPTSICLAWNRVNIIKKGWSWFGPVAETDTSVLLTSRVKSKNPISHTFFSLFSSFPVSVERRQ